MDEENLAANTISPSSPTEEKKPDPKGKRFLKVVGGFFWQGKLFPAFWTISSIISLAVNIALLILVISLGRQLFTIKHIVQDNLIAGLYSNFMLMDEARIQTTIPVETKVPAKFDLILDTDTTVILSEDTEIPDAWVQLKTGGLTIDAPADIVLPANTELPIHLNLVVPVDKKIPVNLDVAVDIPLKETELHEPFVGLQEVLEPYYAMLYQMPGSWEEVFCGEEPSEKCHNFISKIGANDQK